MIFDTSNCPSTIDTKFYGTITLTNEFSAKGLQKSTLNDFIKHLKQTGSITSESGSGRPRTAQTTANIDAVELVLSQKYEYANTRFSRNLSYCTVSLCSILLAQHQFVNSNNVGGRSRCSWPATTRLNKVVQRTFLSSFSGKFIC